jgi:MarR family transcriptional regulator for hemolysin
VLDELPGGTRGYRLLVAVAEDELPNQLALAQHAGLDRTVVTYLVDDLVAEGLVERRPDPTDRRAKRIVMTQQGCDRLAHFKAKLRDVEGEVLKSLADDDVVQLRSLLHKVAQDLGAPSPITCNEVAVLTAEIEQPRRTSAT